MLIYKKDKIQFRQNAKRQNTNMTKYKVKKYKWNKIEEYRKTDWAKYRHMTQEKKYKNDNIQMKQNIK